MQQGGGGGSQTRQLRRGQPTGETVLTRWVGHLAVLKYLAARLILQTQKTQGASLYQSPQPALGSSTSSGSVSSE